MRGAETESERKLVGDVRDYGWHVINVPADDKGPGFSYTIGLYHTFHHPELIVVGLPITTGHQILNLAGESIRNGAIYRDGSEADKLLDGYRCRFRTLAIEHYGDYVGYAVWFYEAEPFPILQLIYPDSNHRFPWEEGATPAFRSMQSIGEDDSGNPPS